MLWTSVVQCPKTSEHLRLYNGEILKSYASHFLCLQVGIDVAAHVAEDLGKAFGERLVKALFIYQQVKKVLEKYQWFIIYNHTAVK